MVTIRKFTACAIGCTFAGALGAPTAQAQTPNDKTAEQLFRDGVDAMDRGDWAKACPKFESSAKLTRRSGTLFNLSKCSEKDGRLVRAAALWREAIAMLPVGDERLAASREGLSALERRIPHVTLLFPNDPPPDARVRVDGVDVHAGAPFAIDPGAHVALTSASGVAEHRTTFTIFEGEQKDVKVELEGMNTDAKAQDTKPERQPTVVAPAPAPAPSEDSKRSKSGRTVGIVSVGVGAASLVAGGITGLMTLGEKSDVDKICGTHSCNATGFAAESDGKTFSTVSTITFLAGAVAVGAGTVLILTAKPSPMSPTTARLGAAPLPGGGLATLTLVY